MSITTQSVTILASDLSVTVVTDVVQDPGTGRYVREFRFYGPAASLGAAAPLLLTVRAESPDEDAIRYKTSPLSI